MKSTTEAYQVIQLPDTTYVTGLDNETASSLGKSINQDLSSTSKFWEDFIIVLDSDNPRVLSKNNAMDVITYHALIANGYVAPSKEMASDPRYLSAKYYCHIEEVEEETNISNRKLIDRAKAKLISIENNKELLYLLGSYLEGGKYKKQMKADTLYGMLSDFIEDKKGEDNAEKFLKAAELPLEDIQYKVTVETAIRKKILKFKEGQYYRGGVNFGRTVLEVLDNLKKPDYANEFIQIHEEVNN